MSTRREFLKALKAIDTVDRQENSLRLDLASIINESLNENPLDSQRALADRMGIDEATVSKIINCRTNWRCRTVARIADALGLNLELRRASSNSTINISIDINGELGQFDVKEEGSRIRFTSSAAS